MAWKLVQLVAIAGLLSSNSMANENKMNFGSNIWKNIKRVAIASKNRILEVRGKNASKSRARVQSAPAKAVQSSSSIVQSGSKTKLQLSLAGSVSRRATARKETTTEEASSRPLGVNISDYDASLSSDKASANNIWNYFTFHALLHDLLILGSIIAALCACSWQKNALKYDRESSSINPCCSPTVIIPKNHGGAALFIVLEEQVSFTDVENIVRSSYFRKALNAMNTMFPSLPKTGYKGEACDQSSDTAFDVTEIYDLKDDDQFAFTVSTGFKDEGSSFLRAKGESPDRVVGVPPNLYVKGTKWFPLRGKNAPRNVEVGKGTKRTKAIAAAFPIPFSVSVPVSGSISAPAPGSDHQLYGDDVEIRLW